MTHSDRHYEHVIFLDGWANVAQTYPNALRRAICKGLVRQIQADRQGQFLLMEMDNAPENAKSLMNMSKNIEERCRYFSAVLMYKTVNGLAPPYLCDTVCKTRYAHERITRLSNTEDVMLPTFKSEYGKRTFTYHCGKIWNELDNQLNMAFY